ncbi:hypothetical protein NDU88_013331 [Pleurodeles waltl]|uniref:Uncharacterized protein n=1 Tax=Pleurodeles waltl TaxID=8319 RepID=A0AAV7R4F2_PLEWA|nr:hypothetical protein NDU88_013331 [Pleurodeles waltl]
MRSVQARKVFLTVHKPLRWTSMTWRQRKHTVTSPRPTLPRHINYHQPLTASRLKDTDASTKKECKHTGTITPTCRSPKKESLQPSRRILATYRTGSLHGWQLHQAGTWLAHHHCHPSALKRVHPIDKKHQSPSRESVNQRLPVHPDLVTRACLDHLPL